jgi:iron complex outermembrane receptor protein
VDQGQSSSPSTVERQDEQASTKKPNQLEEVIVTGSRIPVAAGQQQAQPVRSYTREVIERSGQTTVADFLNTLPDVSLSSNSMSGGSQLGVTSGVRLHGLPLGMTLTLIDGLRVEIGYVGNFDLGTIPAAAVERIEVLPVGASAIYGADSLGGAVNIILRKNFSGFEAGGTLTHIVGANDTNVHMGWGKSWERGSIMLIGTYQEIGELLGSQRAPTSDTTFPVGVPAFFFTSDDCSPGNVYSLDGLNLPGLQAPQAAIPPGISGTPTRQQFAATAGKTNLCNFNRLSSIDPHTQREALLFSGHFQATQSIDLFGEILASYAYHRPIDRDLIDATGGSFGGTILGAGNPYNPFGQDVGVSFAYDGLQSGYRIPETLLRPMIGLRGSLFSDWHYQATAYVSRDRLVAKAPPRINLAAFQTALNSSNPATALNPFTTGAPGTPQLLQSFMSNSFVGHYVNQTTDGQAILRGPLLNLPAGPLEAVVGGESSAEKLFADGSLVLNAPLNFQRHTYAGFTEARIPLLREREQPQKGDRLAVMLAGRYDHTSDFGGKATWQSGLLWRATQALAVSGGYGASYKAPQLTQIQGKPFILNNLVRLSDPLRGGEVDLIPTFTFGSNPNLKAETGNSGTLSVEYSGEAPHGFKAGLTWYNVDISNYIAIVDNPVLLRNPSVFPGAVVRAPASAQDQAKGFLGPITAVYDLYRNFGDLHVAGIDADLSYAFDTGVGRLTPSVALTNTYKWQSALTPGSPSIGYVNQAAFSPGWAPRWKGTVALAWERGPLSANLAGRYVSRYKDYQDFGPTSFELGNSWFVDVNLRYEAGAAFANGNRWLAGTFIAVGASNLFYKNPPFSIFSVYDPTQYDIRGRMLTLQVGVKY